MNDELQRRISEALDAPGGLASDDPLRAGPAAAAYADDLIALGSALETHATGAAPEPDWDALAGSIAARLGSDEALDDIGDVTAAPLPETDEERAILAALLESERAVAASGEAPAVVLAVNAPARPESNVVDLASRRRVGWMTAVGGLAAAAAVILGVSVGFSMLGAGADQESMAAEAMARGEAAPAPTVATWDDSLNAEEAEWDAPEPSSAAPSGAPVAAGTLAPAALPMEPAAEAAADLQDPWAEGEADNFALREAQPRRRARPSASATGRVAVGGYGTEGAPAPLPAPAPGRAGGARAASTPDTLAQGAQPSSADVQRAFAAVAATVQRCLGERREVVRARAEVSANGTVTDVTILSPHAGQPVAGCLIRAISRARMPRSASGYSAGHAFRPAPIAGSGGSRTNSSRARTGTSSSRAHRSPAPPH